MTELEPEILERARRGDRDAHAALYRAYAPMVFTVARRMLGSHAAAEDVLQDSFVEVIRKADRFRGECGVGHWIRQIAINKCLSQLRSPWIRKRVEIPDDAAEHAFGAAVPPVEREESFLDGPFLHSDDLERALDSLSRTARAVVWLHDVEGYTHEEIGRLMSRTTSFSKSQLARAYRELRVALQGSGVADALPSSEVVDAAPPSQVAGAFLPSDGDDGRRPDDVGAGRRPNDVGAGRRHNDVDDGRSIDVDQADQADEETERCLGVLKTV